MAVLLREHAHHQFADLLIILGKRVHDAGHVPRSDAAAADDPAAHPPVHGVEQLLLAAEAAQHRLHGDAGIGRHVLEPDLVEPALLETMLEGVEDAVARRRGGGGADRLAIDSLRCAPYSCESL